MYPDVINMCLRELMRNDQLGVRIVSIHIVQEYSLKLCGETGNETWCQKVGFETVEI